MKMLTRGLQVIFHFISEGKLRKIPDWSDDVSSDIINGVLLHVDHEFGNCDRIGVNGSAHKIEGGTGNLLVAAPLRNGHRGIAGDEFPRWSDVKHGELAI